MTRTPPDTAHEVAVANAILRRIAARSPIHGALRAGTSSEPYPLLLAGVHCSACEAQAGGALDFSGEVGPTDGESAVRSLLDTLADRGCHHVATLAADTTRAREGDGRP